MTINIDHTAKLLQASCDLISKDKQIAALKESNALLVREIELQDAQITALQCRLQRSVLPFKRAEAHG